MDEKIQSADEAVKPVRKWRCSVCGYVYEGAELPEDFTCPLCGVGADEFEEITDEE